QAILIWVLQDFVWIYLSKDIKDLKEQSYESYQIYQSICLICRDMKDFCPKGALLPPLGTHQHIE
ncbi:MAG: hypothetical protein IJ551_06695, partial [Prevotella sp.]|nr:hypothetical protein [Prevotella sp.]